MAPVILYELYRIKFTFNATLVKCCQIDKYPWLYVFVNCQFFLTILKQNIIVINYIQIFKKCLGFYAFIAHLYKYRR